MLAKVLAVVVAIALSHSARAEDTADLLGTWVLVSSVTEKDGITTDQFGSGAAGMMTLDSGGHFLLTIIGVSLPRFVSNNRAAGTAEENKAVMSRSIAMIGSYEHNPLDKTLTFNVENSTFPNWNGTQQKRAILVHTKDTLQYITPTASSGGVGTVTWRRAN